MSCSWLEGWQVLNLYCKACFGTFRSGISTGVATFQGSRLSPVHCTGSALYTLPFTATVFPLQAWSRSPPPPHSHSHAVPLTAIMFVPAGHSDAVPFATPERECQQLLGVWGHTVCPVQHRSRCQAKLPRNHLRGQQHAKCHHHQNHWQGKIHNSSIHSTADFTWTGKSIVFLWAVAGDR